MKIGTDPFSTPASEDGIHCSPVAISETGMRIWITATTTTQPNRSRTPARAPERSAIGSKKSAPSTSRRKVTEPGERSRSPTLMSA